MADFPDIGRLIGIQEIDVKGQLKGETDAGYVITSARGTVIKQKFQVSYLLTSTERVTLQTFFNTNLGGVFNWIHPLTSTTHSMFFLDGELKFTWNQNEQRYRSTFGIREA